MAPAAAVAGRAADLAALPWFPGGVVPVLHGPGG